MTLADWQAIITESVRTVFMGLVEAFPGIVAAAITLLIGWILARMARGVMRRVFRAADLDKRLESLKLDLLFDKMGMQVKPSDILANTVYYLIVLVFLVAASETLGWDIISEEFAKLLAFIPKAIIGMIIFAIGYFVAGLIRDVLSNATEALGVGAGKIIAGAVYWFLLITVTLSALQQMGLPTDILSENLQLIIGAVVIAGAISYGLASRDILRNTLSTFYGRNTFAVGQRIRVEDVEGTIEEVTNISVILKTANGRTVLPASELTNKRVEILDA
jgi:hypothetical protein